VYYKDKLLGYGSVVLYSADGRGATAAIDTDGTYWFEEVPAGEARLAVVSIDPAKAAGRPQRRPPTESEKGTEAVRVLPGDPSLWFEIPHSYGDVNTSGLTVVVGRGSTTHDIRMK
jgi:hypothetical protein